MTRPCWHCGGSGVRCCEFAAGVSDDELRARRDLYGTRSGAVQAAPVNPPIEDAADDVCPRCEGAGDITIPGRSLDRMRGMRVPDHQEDLDFTCPACGGTGTRQARRRGRAA